MMVNHTGVKKGVAAQHGTANSHIHGRPMHGTVLFRQRTALQGFCLLVMRRRGSMVGLRHDEEVLVGGVGIEAVVEVGKEREVVVEHQLIVPGAEAG